MLKAVHVPLPLWWWAIAAVILWSDEHKKRFSHPPLEALPCPPCFLCDRKKVFPGPAPLAPLPLAPNDPFTLICFPPLSNFSHWHCSSYPYPPLPLSSPGPRCYSLHPPCALAIFSWPTGFQLQPADTARLPEAGETECFFPSFRPSHSFISARTMPTFILPSSLSVCQRKPPLRATSSRYESLTVLPFASPSWLPNSFHFHSFHFPRWRCS